jgi:hypothetical protein
MCWKDWIVWYKGCNVGESWRYLQALTGDHNLKYLVFDWKCGFEDNENIWRGAVGIR